MATAFESLPEAAAAGATLAQIEALVARGADLEAGDELENSTALLHASRLGDVAVVSSLLDAGAKLDARNKHGWTALHRAAQGGSVETMRLLVARGADVHAVSTDALTILYVAAKHNKIATATYALDLGVDVNACKAAVLLTPLHVACEFGFIAMMKLLVARGANVHAGTRAGLSIFYLAAGKAKMDAVKCALDVGVAVDVAKADGMTALLYAAEKGQVAMMKLLVERGANVHARNDAGRSLVYCATLSKSIEAMQYALGLGVDIEAALDETRFTALHCAANAGEATAMRVLVQRGANAHALTKTGATALYLAAGSGVLAAVKCALDFGIDVNKARGDGFAPLRYAAEQGHVAVMQLLIDHGAGAHVVSNTGATILYAACGKGKLKVAKCALDAGVDPNAANKDGYTALYYAAEQGQITAMRLLAERGANVHAVAKSGGTALYIASGRGNIEVVKLALDLGIDVNQIRTDGYSPLLFAAEKGDVDVMRLLVEHGADIHALTNATGRSVVYCAVMSEKLEAVEYAIELGLDVDAPTKTGLTTLHLAAQKGNTAMMQLLLDRDANINAVTKAGASVIETAMADGKADAVTFLLDAGLQVSGVDQNGWSAYHRAAKEGSVAMMKALQERGEAVDSVTNEGRTVLHIGALEGKLEVVEYAVQQALDIELRDNNGWTALHCAAKSGDARSLSYLFKHGGDPFVLTKEGNSLLLTAVASESVEAIESVLTMGVAVDTCKENGLSAMHLAAELGNAAAMRCLVDHGARVDAVLTNGRTILHCASAKGKLESLQFALDASVDINATTKVDWETPLFFATRIQEHRVAYQLAFELCARGALWTPLHDQHAVPKAPHQEKWLSGLCACIRKWVEAVRLGVTPIAVPSNVVERGAESVDTYLVDVAQSDADDVVYRCKVCVVGPSEWGKSSLVHSLQSMQPILVKPEGRTEGVELVPTVFTQPHTNGDGKSARRYEVTFWDFSGKDVYQVSHSLFFSRRTLYAVAIDLPAYAAQLANPDELSADQSEFAMDRFLSTRVFRWVRMIFAQQLDAHFLFVGTKQDCLQDPVVVEEIWADLQDRLDDWKKAFIQELENGLDAPLERTSALHRSSMSLSDDDDAGGAASVQEMKQRVAAISADWLVVSSANEESITHAREKIHACVAAADLGFPMWKTYSQVREFIEQRREAAKQCGGESARLESLIVRFTQLRKQILKEIAGLQREDCEQILRSLHELGDVLWFDFEEAGDLSDFVILDPMLGIEIVREVIGHDFSAAPTSQSVKDGRVSHALLRTFPLWRAMDTVLTHGFKMLLQHFQLAYPADNEFMLPESDLIMPTYWKALKFDPARSISRQKSKLDDIAKNRWCWEYEVPAGLSDTVFEQFAVQSTSSYLQRSICANCIESACREFGCRVLLIEGDTRNDVIRIEVASASAEMSWHNMRFYLMKMEKILEGYPGMPTLRFVTETTRGQMLESRHALEPAVKKLVDAIALGRDAQALRRELPWLPADMDWFIRKSWKDIGSFQQLQLDQLVRDKLEVLRKLAIVDDAPRRYPALWSVEFKPAEKKVVLRLSSDLSGRCYHVPIEIDAGPAFLAKYGAILKEGVSLCSTVVSNAISLPLVGNVIDAAKSAFDDKVARTKQVHNLIERLDLSSSSNNQFDSRTTALTPGSATLLLRDVLKTYNDSMDDLEMSEISNLECAVTANGEFVWAHAHEIDMLKDKIARCAAPPSTWADLEQPEPSPQDSPTKGSGSPTQSGASSGSTTAKAAQRPSVSFSIDSVAGLTSSDWYKTYCKWNLFYGKSLTPIASGVTAHTTSNAAPPSWGNVKMLVDAVSSVEMLRGCRLHVRVKHRTMIGWTKFLGGGEVALGDYIDADVAQQQQQQQPHWDPIDIAIDETSPPKRWVTVQFSIAH